MFTSSNLNLRYPSQTLRTGLAAVGGLGLFAASIYFFADNAHAESKDSTPRVFSSVFGQRLRLASAEVVNHNTKLLRFELPHAHARCGLPLTSSLLVVSWPRGSIFPVARPYTPISSSSQHGFIDLLVKRYPNGKSSTHLHSLERGQSVLFAFRLPGYAWVPNRFDHIVLIAGGAGITPIYQLTRGILENPDDQTKITLLFAVNRDDDLVLKKEFDNFEHSFPTRFRAVYTVSNPIEGSSHRKGRLTKDLLQEVLADSRSKNPQIFLCGPPAMEESLVGISRPFGAGKPGILQELGYEKNQIVRF